MPSIGEITRSRTQRRYWVLFALLLFFAGQVAVAAHWHNDGTAVSGKSSVNDKSSFTERSSLDIDCALCALSSAASAAIIDSGFAFAAATFGAVLFFVAIATIRCAIVVSYQSRAPPIRF